MSQEPPPHLCHHSRLAQAGCQQKPPWDSTGSIPGAQHPRRQGVTPAAMPGESPPPPWVSRVLSGAVFIDLSKGSDVAGCASPSSHRLPTAAIGERLISLPDTHAS